MNLFRRLCGCWTCCPTTRSCFNSRAAAVFCILSELSWRQLRTFFVLPTLWIFTLCSIIGERETWCGSRCHAPCQACRSHALAVVFEGVYTCVPECVGRARNASYAGSLGHASSIPQS